MVIFMIGYLAELLSNYFVKNKIILSEDKNIYKYGAEVTISSILGILVIVIISAFLGKIQDGILFLLCFIPIRVYTGGYHANTYIKCNFIFIIVFLLIILGSSNLPEVFEIQISIFVGIVSLVLIILLSPIENKHKPICSDEKKKYKKISITISSLWFIFSVILLFIFDINLLSLIMLIMFSIAILMIVEKIIQIKNAEGK